MTLENQEKQNIDIFVCRIFQVMTMYDNATKNRVKLLDRGCAKAGQCAEHGPFDLCNLRILHRIDKGVLCLRCVVLEFFGGVLFAKGSNFVEIHPI